MKRRFTLLYVLLLWAAYAAGAAPQPGWVTEAQVVEVYDGDTVVVDVTKRFHVRLLDCWAPEIRTRDEAEKQRGFASRDHLRGLIADRAVILSVPSHQGDVSQSFTFGRVLGRIYRKDGKDVSRLMVESGYATAEKQPAADQ